MEEELEVLELGDTKPEGEAMEQELEVLELGDTKPEDVESYSQNLKYAVKTRLIKHEITPIFEKFKLEDIFMNAVVKYYQVIFDFIRQSKSPKHKEVKKNAHIFLDEATKETHKSILIKGGAGVGKSLFCRKLAQEWAEDCLFDPKESADNPVIKFTFLMSFRQLNKLGQNNLNLRELLNLCCMLDEKTAINDFIMEYIIEHPEQLLILIDGLDEYEDDRRERLFPDDPRLKMPATVLVSKLVKKKILSNSVLMVTSRPDTADEVTNLHFEIFIEINELSEQQVIGHVEIFFKHNKEMQTKALRTVQDYLSFGRAPPMCLLMCAYIEYSDSRESLPRKLTQTLFYNDVVQFIEKNYNKAIQKANLDEKAALLVVERIKDNMSELAAKLLECGKNSFNENDLQELDLSELDLTYLKSSSLLFTQASVASVYEYIFIHPLIQEYFSARCFVKRNAIPTEATLSKTILQFMAGSMDPQKDKQLIKKLLERIDNVKFLHNPEVLPTILYEYDDKELVKSVVRKNKHNRFWNSDGMIGVFGRIDYKVVVMLVDVLTTLNQEQSSASNVPHWLNISGSPITRLGVESLFKSLSNKSCTITKLTLRTCYIDDKSIECLIQYLPQTKLTYLDLGDNEITGECSKHVRKLLSNKYPDLKLILY